MKVIDNPHVALNNARNLPSHTAKGSYVPPRPAIKPPTLPSTAEKKRLLAYIKARRTRAECDEFIAQNKGDVFDILGKLPGGNFTQANAMIYQADSVSYQYPAEIIQIEQELAATKKLAQLDGRARKILKGCVKFESLD